MAQANQMEKKIRGVTVVHDGNIADYPPVISLVENLLQKSISVYLISSTEGDKLPSNFFTYANFSYSYIPGKKSGVLGRVDGLTRYRKAYVNMVNRLMQNSDILWTTTDGTAKLLGTTVLKYKHVMQLMELIEFMPVFSKIRFIKAPIDKYAQKAYKVVVPQIDRAYIQQAWWNLKNTPSVLPNKPYNLCTQILDEKTKDAINTIKNEDKKVLLYMGVVGADRTIEPFVEAIKLLPDYSLFIIGRPAADSKYLEQLLKKYNNIHYLGFFTPPNHLEFLKYAHIGIMPYKTERSRHYSELNALYCAPNKIFEYSGYGIPMIGTNVLGLKNPFERYEIGICCKDLTPSTIVDCIRAIDNRYEEYRNNCLEFYDSIDLDDIVKGILYE